MFLGNDEELRSKEWKVATLVSTILIVVIAIYFLTKIFTANPLKGAWEDEDGSLNLKIGSNGKMDVQILGLSEDEAIELKMEYTLDKDAKIITVTADDTQIQEIAELSDGQYTQEILHNEASRIATTFNYNVEQGELTLTEREYGDQMTFFEK